jgi:hypothetical protein
MAIGRRDLDRVKMGRRQRKFSVKVAGVRKQSQSSLLLEGQDQNNRFTTKYVTAELVEGELLSPASTHTIDAVRYRNRPERPIDPTLGRT